MNKEEYFRMGLLAYEEGRYWDAHEAWEDVWRDSEGNLRRFVQALIQLAAALIHAERNEWGGVTRLIQRAQANLRGLESNFWGIDIARLHRDLDRLEVHTRRLRNGEIRRFLWRLRPILSTLDSPMRRRFRRSASDGGPASKRRGSSSKPGKVAGVLLAGGASRRFGGDKRFVRIGNQVLLNYQIEKMKRAGLNIYLAVEPGFPFLFYRGCEILWDPECYGGPLQAMAGLPDRVIRNGVVILGVDMAGVTSDFIEDLANHRNWDIRCPMVNHRLQPLVGYYSARSFRYIRRAFKAGERSISRFIRQMKENKRLKIHYIKKDYILKFGNIDIILCNINRIQDLSRYFKYFNNSL